MPAPPLSLDSLIVALKAAGEATRFRVLALLGQGELTVKDLTAILGQSQPRISRHLKLLTEAGLVERNPEAAWVFYRLSDDERVGRLAKVLSEAIDIDDETLARDRERLIQVKQEHAAEAQRYFAANAADWDTIRALHVADDAVEAAIMDAVGAKPLNSVLDLGTGSGRILELLSDLYARGIGIDTSTDMLAVARANLDRAGVTHAQVRLGDIYHLPLPRDSFDLVTIHQVLHYLADPERAIAEAARVLRPGGRLLIVDFAPHEMEFLREKHAHRRLGFGHEPMRQWIEAPGLRLETVRDLAAPGAAARKLTVTLWLGRDQRMALAADTLNQEVA